MISKDSAWSSAGGAEESYTATGDLTNEKEETTKNEKPLNFDRRKTRRKMWKTVKTEIGQ